MAKWDQSGCRDREMSRLTASFSGKTDIIKKILETAEGESGLREREIMNNFFLPNLEVDKYLSSMIQNNLLQYDEKTRSYRATEKGSDFLKSIRKIYELDDIVDLKRSD